MEAVQKLFKIQHFFKKKKRKKINERVLILKAEISQREFQVTFTNLPVGDSN